MRFLLSEDYWALDSLFPGEWEWIRILPRLASGEDFLPGSRERLLPSPLAPDVMADESTLSQMEDWDELIRPELAETFAEAREIVEEDLERSEELTIEAYSEDDPIREELAEAGFPGDLPEMRRIVVAHEHTEAWYSTLNQARLLMNEEYDLANAEERQLIRAMDPSLVGEDRLLLIAQYELYSVIQSILVENLMQD
jgi:hypothetical protein